MIHLSGRVAFLGIFLGAVLVTLEQHSADAWMPSLITSPKTRTSTHRAAYLGNLLHNNSDGIDQHDDENDDDAMHQPSGGRSVRQGETSLIAMMQRLAAEKKELEESQPEPLTDVLAAHPMDTIPRVVAPKGDASVSHTIQSSKQLKEQPTNVVVPNSSGVGSLDSSIPREVEHDLQVAAFAPKDSSNIKKGSDKQVESPVEEAVVMKAVGDLATAGTVEQEGSEVAQIQDELDVEESDVPEAPLIMDAKKKNETVVPLTTTAAYMDSLDTTNSDDNTPVDMPLPTLTTGIKLTTEEDLIQQHNALDAHEASFKQQGAGELYQSQLQVAFGTDLSYPDDKMERDEVESGTQDPPHQPSKQSPAKLDQHMESANMVYESLEDLDKGTHEYNKNNDLENGVVNEDGGGDELVQSLKQLLLDIHLGFTDMKTAMVSLMEEDPALERNQKYWNWGLETGGGSSDGEGTGLLP